MTLSICTAQLNFVVGDMPGNAQKIIAAAREAHALGAQLLLTPELAVCGYAAEDLFLRLAFLAACDDAVKAVARETAGLQGLAIVLGHPQALSADAAAFSVCRNAASVVRNGQIEQTYFKRELPNYQVFDERRYFASGRDAGLGPVVFDVQGVRFGLLICEDAWLEEPATAACAAGAQVLCVLNASPFHIEKHDEREERMAERARATGCALLYSHLVGGQDEIIFDGASFGVDAQGIVQTRALAFDPDSLLLDVTAAGAVSGPLAPIPPLEEQVWRALVLGVRDYLGKNGFPGAIIGLSGGVDSALVLAVAVEALGADKVRAVMMPSQFTADISWIDSRDMVKRLDVRYDEIPIKQTFDAFRATLAEDFAGLAEDATEENIQARIRGTLLMALSNKHGSIVLTTGNKSEMAVGYCTLYGDMAGGFAVIKDIAKTLVYRLCAYRNSVSDVIPERILTRGPSAELRADQLDQDSLPPYDILDGIMQLYMEENRPIAEIIEAGYPPADVARITRLIKINEYKRRQSPVGIRVTHRGFGRDWRYPITSKFYE